MGNPSIMSNKHTEQGTKRSTSYRALLGVIGVVGLVLGGYAVFIGFQIRPCYGSTCAFVNALLSTAVGRGVFGVLVMGLGVHGLRVAATGRDPIAYAEEGT